MLLSLEARLHNVQSKLSQWSSTVLVHLKCSDKASPMCGWSFMFTNLVEYQLIILYTVLVNKTTAVIWQRQQQVQAAAPQGPLLDYCFRLAEVYSYGSSTLDFDLLYTIVIRFFFFVFWIKVMVHQSCRHSVYVYINIHGPMGKLDEAFGWRKTLLFFLFWSGLPG